MSDVEEMAVPTCVRCGDPMTSGCTSSRCAILEADVEDEQVDAAVRYLYDHRYGPGAYANRFGPDRLDVERGSARQQTLWDEMRALMGSHLIAAGWTPPGWTGE